MRLSKKLEVSNPAWLASIASQVSIVVQQLSVLRRWDRFALTQAGYLAIWFSLAGANYAVLEALDISLPLEAAFVVLVVLQVGTSIPSTPGKVGVFQYLTVLALAPFGVEREVALTYSVLLQVVGFGPLVALGGFWSWIGLTDS